MADFLPPLGVLSLPNPRALLTEIFLEAALRWPASLAGTLAGCAAAAALLWRVDMPLIWGRTLVTGAWWILTAAGCLAASAAACHWYSRRNKAILLLPLLLVVGFGALCGFTVAQLQASLHPMVMDEEPGVWFTYFCFFSKMGAGAAVPPMLVSMAAAFGALWVASLGGRKGGKRRG